MRKMATKCVLIATLVTLTLASNELSAQVSRSPVAPRRELVEAVVREAYERFKSDTNGKNADYIPYLAQVDSKLFGVAVVTTDNQVFTLGDVNYSFSIQSISKVFTLALAMEELGPNKVFDKVGSEPTGRPFNSPLAVVDMPTHTGNPLVNAGAIATTSLISGNNAEDKWNKILNFYGKAAGEKLHSSMKSTSQKRRPIPGTRPSPCFWPSMIGFMQIRSSPWTSTRSNARWA